MCICPADDTMDAANSCRPRLCANPVRSDERGAGGPDASGSRRNRDGGPFVGRRCCRKPLRGACANGPERARLSQVEERLRRISGAGRAGTAGVEVGGRRGAHAHRDELLLDAADRISSAFYAGGICAVDGRAGAEEKCWALDDAEFRGVRVCVPCLLCDRLRVSVRSGGGEYGSSESGRRSYVESFPDWKRAMGISWRQGIFPERTSI